MSKDDTSDRKPSVDMSEFQQAMRSAKSIIAVCGAGLSAASGIPTFRGAGGMWRKYDAMSLATPEAFAENPSLVWQFYHYRREKARASEPNAAHKALAVFSVPSYRKIVAPNADSFSIITQNVDGLSVKALNKVLEEEGGAKPAGIAPILEMHGRIHDVYCTSKSCKHAEYNTSSPLCAALRGTEDTVEAGTIDAVIPKEELPRCSKCNAMARPGVVWFGERPKYMVEINALVDAADLCLVVGTSSTVYPAAGYATEVQDHGGKVAVFNLDRSTGDGDADFLFLGPCEKTLPEALGFTRKAELQ
ncbi:NAD-dependent protein deacylase [Mycena haematopus]|nr:NAD-dependent protein deacylase [Mycena haematopus]